MVMEKTILESALGGYSKKDVLARTDAYNSLIVLIEGGRISDAVINAELEKIRQMPVRKARFLFFPGPGFSVPQTEKYFSDLEKEIKQKIML